jgi:hypothetical protein
MYPFSLVYGRKDQNFSNKPKASFSSQWVQLFPTIAKFRVPEAKPKIRIMRATGTGAG